MESREVSPNQEQLNHQERLSIDCYSNTIACERHPGRNEDDSFFDSSKGIFGVFDGMGGMSDGQWCAQTSRQTIEEILSLNHHLLPKDGREVLTSASKKANEKVFESKKGRGGSTATFGLLCQTSDGVSQIVLANTGDSRAYLVRDSKLIKLTVDDNLSKTAGQSIQNELDIATNEEDLSQQAYGIFLNRDQISNFIGIGKDVQTKIIIQTVLPGDLLVLTTDGVHDNLTTTEISQIISQNIKNPELISQKLTESALQRSRERVLRSKPDDMVALVVKLKKDETAQRSQIELNSPSTEFIPEVGQEITLQRTSGTIEGNWKIKYIQGDNLTVTKPYKGDVYDIKSVTISQVERFNRPPKIEDIATSANKDQLRYALKKFGGLQGSNRYYSAQDLLTLIDIAYQNQGSAESLQNITRVGELRQTVKRLIVIATPKK